jgi:4-hydroxythreonine-4-phosphate dehydrogenase
LPNPRKKNLPRGNRIIAVTLGDPQGIGPEVIAKSLEIHAPEAALVIVGARRYFPVGDVRVIRAIDQARPGQASLLDMAGAPAGADHSFVWVKTAVEMALRGEVQALVTAPVSKNKWLASGVPFRGHTDFFASFVQAAPPAMFFWSPGLKVALFSHHIPLRDIFARLERGRIVKFIRLVDRELRRLFGQEFIFLFSGLNPHAGEEGRLGGEEIDVIIPAINDLRDEIRVEGPYPPDVVFAKARAIRNAVVIAWTHDQGLIPFKLLHAADGVQLTLGLPFIRTSPVHGTAFDIAGKGIADPASMLASLRLAESLLP